MFKTYSTYDVRVKHSNYCLEQKYTGINECATPLFACIFGFSNNVTLINQ
jgi:hypothetical protein